MIIARSHIFFKQNQSGTYRFLPILGFSHTTVEYVREKRFAGMTKYPFLKMLRFSLDGMTAFSILPLRIATCLGFAIALLALLYVPYALYVKFISQTAVLGWTTVIVAIFFLGGIQLFCIGILGEYIGIIRFAQIKTRHAILT